MRQRFQRHLNITNDTQNETLIDGLNFPDISDELAADELPGIQEGDDVRLNGYGEIPIELNDGQLKFEFCSDGCLGKTVIICYDASNIVSSLQTGCGTNQCNFQAGVSEDVGGKYLWFMAHRMSTPVTSNLCESAVMKSPEAIISFSTAAPIISCEPLKNNGNVVKLFVRAVPTGCSLKIKNAKIWVPTTPSATTPSESATTEDYSKIGSIVWIILGILLFILVIGFIAFGIYCFCIKKQKKSAGIFDEKPKEILAENKKTLESQKIENVGNEKSEKPKESVKTEKERTKEKQETVEEKSVNQKKDVEKPKQKVTKKKADVQPTVEEATTEASIVQKPKVPEHFPSARVSKELILPVPKSHVKKMKPKNGGSTKTDSLSGRHEVTMQGLVGSPSESFKRY